MVQKYEQIQDALESGRLSPKGAEQMNQTLKGIMGVERLSLQFLSLALKYGRTAPVPRTPILRSVLGLPASISATDGAAVRAMLPEK